MGDHDRAEFSFPAKVMKQLKNQIAGPRIKIAGWFIGEQQLRLHDQSPGEGRSLLFTAGKFQNFMVAAMTEFHLGQEFLCRVEHLLLTPAGNETGDHDIFQGGEIGEQMMELKDEAHRCVAKIRQFFWRAAQQWLVAVEHLSCAGQIEGAEDLQQGGFAGAGGTDNPCHFAGFNSQGNALQDAYGILPHTVVFRDIAGGKESHQDNTSAGCTAGAFHEGYRVARRVMTMELTAMMVTSSGRTLMGRVVIG